MRRRDGNRASRRMSRIEIEIASAEKNARDSLETREREREREREIRAIAIADHRCFILGVANAIKRAQASFDVSAQFGYL